MSGGRIRSIKPEILDDEDVAELSDSAWRLWVSLWVMVDDWGNSRAGTRYLSAQVWQDTGRDSETPLAELVRSERVDLYMVRGQRYVHVRNWEKHQRVKDPGKERVPGPSESDDLAPVSRNSAEEFCESRNSAEKFRSRARTSPIPTPTPTPIPEEQTNTSPSAPVPDKPGPAAEVRSVFAHWVTERCRVVGGKPEALKLTGERRRKIQARLAEGFTAEQLCRSIDGMLATPFNLEKNFTDVELACRDAAHVTRYSEAAPYRRRRPVEPEPEEVPADPDDPMQRSLLSMSDDERYAISHQLLTGSQ